MSSILQVQNLTKTFGDVVALKNVTFDVKKGEIFGVIGLSGAGKSSLIRSINLLEKPDGGKVVFCGQEVTQLKGKNLREVRSQMSMIFQSFNLFEQRTALKNVCFPLEIKGVKREQAQNRAKELLQIVGLSGKENSYPSQLSGGQKQRVAIARALASDPKILLCDEATSALDPETTDSVLSLIYDLSKSLGVTVILVTHEMSAVSRICDRVAVMSGGEIAEIGDVVEVFTNPSSPATKRLVVPQFSQRQNSKEVL